jgi:hypothetical protein
MGNEVVTGIPVTDFELSAGHPTLTAAFVARPRDGYQADEIRTTGGVG